MLGLIDRLGKFPLEESLTEGFEVIDNSTKGMHTWFCFLPAIAYNNRVLRGRVLPRKNKSQIIYRLPYPSVVSDPVKIREYFDEIYLGALSHYERGAFEEVSVLGVSLGNAPAFRFANEFSCNCSRLLSIVPGADVPHGISVGSATKHIFEAAKQKKYGIGEFRAALDLYSPENNLCNLPKDIEVHLGGRDLMVPYKQGEQLVEAIEKSGRNPKVVRRKFLGHLETIAMTRNSY